MPRASIHRLSRLAAAAHRPSRAVQALQQLYRWCSWSAAAAAQQHGSATAGRGVSCTAERRTNLLIAFAIPVLAIRWCSPICSGVAFPGWPDGLVILATQGVARFLYDCKIPCGQDR